MCHLSVRLLGWRGQRRVSGLCVLFSTSSLVLQSTQTQIRPINSLEFHLQTTSFYKASLAILNVVLSVVCQCRGGWARGLVALLVVVFVLLSWTFLDEVSVQHIPVKIFQFQFCNSQATR